MLKSGIPDMIPKKKVLLVIDPLSFKLRYLFLSFFASVQVNQKKVSYVAEWANKIQPIFCNAPSLISLYMCL